METVLNMCITSRQLGFFFKIKNLTNHFKRYLCFLAEDG